MSTLVNNNGDDEIYCPIKKRARGSGPFIVEEETMDPSIETLPDECLFEIFRRLQGGREWSSAACVSKRWLTLLSNVRNSEIWQNDTKKRVSADDDEVECAGYLTRCLEGNKATDVRLAAISVATSSRGGLGKLSVRGTHSVRGITNVGLTAIAHGCPTLKVLSLWNVPYIGDEGLIEISRGCHSLEKLDLSRCPSISDKGLVAIAENCPNLTCLTIESCRNIANEGLQAIGKYCTKLQFLTIKDCPLVGDQAIATLLSSGVTMLKKVKLHGLNITDFSLAVIGHYGKSITDLNFCWLRNVTQKGFWVMGNARGLQALASLTITLCGGATDVGVEAVGKGCTNLKHMFIRRCWFISDVGLVAFARSALSLESLSLDKCNRITQMGILNAVSNCGKLRSLSIVKCAGVRDLPLRGFTSPSHCESLRSLTIHSCPGFGSTSLAMLGYLCPNLHHLDLSGLTGITDSGILLLLQNSKSGLIKVNLTDCVNLTDKVVFALARLHGESLELLNLDGCRNVTNASLVAIADNCPLLNDLDVSKCSITDSGVAALSRGVQVHLQVLSLSDCSMLTNKSFPFLKELGESLLGLNLQNCNGISSNIVDLLVEELYGCDILS